MHHDSSDPIPDGPGASLDLAALAALRRSTGTTVAAVVPARDEAATVGGVVRDLQRMVEADVLTEVVVVDGASSDATVARAAGAGARVIAQEPTPRGLSQGGGKGDAMWQGLVATDSDVVVFADADVRDVPPGFVAPLLVPLLEDPEVLLTKAAYDRPLATGDGPGRDRGGGRVTELLARPVIALLWPELDFLAQPLSGEYAGRRSLLASVPFVQGYGVELGLLVDTVHAHGPDVIREVDLGRRVHAHQPLDALGRMATEILAVALERAAAQGREPVDHPVLRQPVRDGGRLVLAPHPVTVRRRPPSGG